MSRYVAPYLGLDRAGVFAATGLILLVATAANMRGLKVSGRLQLFFSGTVAVLLLLTIIVAIPRMHAANWTPFAPHGIGAIGTVGVTIFFAFFGWEAICHLSAEFKNPARAVPRSTAMSVALITLLYVGIAVVTVGTGTFFLPNTNARRPGLPAFGRRTQISLPSRRSLIWCAAAQANTSARVDSLAPARVA